MSLMTRRLFLVFGSPVAYSGVVLLELHNPDADPPDAVEVEYLDAEGGPGPCVVYSPDLSRVISHHPGYNAP
ncbi:hypothetical protein [Rubrobacter tropicus]|uniref:hypothetical protein n=1 Tax=Rubrobacter tropicus TaxID=2653851 RepID=UPI00140AB3C9|nr:hypothetical protein [Rubrobacter tropicus]